MTKTIRIEYYGMAGEGPTVKEAKADASRRIEATLRELRDASPVIVRVGACIALVAYDGEWGYRLISYDGVGATGPQYLNHGYGDKHETRKACLRHLVEVAWTFDVVDDEKFVDEALSGISTGAPLNHTERREMRDDLLKRFASQRSYRQAKLQGYSDNQARHIAGGLRHLVDSGVIS